MFLFACSLRSTQCAALIALATAAGVARIEPAQTTARSRPDFPECTPISISVSIAHSRESAIRSLAPWFRVIDMLTQHSTVTAAAAQQHEAEPNGMKRRFGSQGGTRVEMRAGQTMTGELTAR